MMLLVAACCGPPDRLPAANSDASEVNSCTDASRRHAGDEFAFIPSLGIGSEATAGAGCTFAELNRLAILGDLLSAPCICAAAGLSAKVCVS